MGAVVLIGAGFGFLVGAAANLILAFRVESAYRALLHVIGYGVSGSLGIFLLSLGATSVGGA